MNSISAVLRSSVLALALAAVPAVAIAQEKRDCSKAPDSARAQCEARNKAEAKCGAMKGADRQICMRDELPRDCAKSDNKARCEAEVAAHKSCRTSKGDAYKKCMMDKMDKKG